MKYGDNRDYPKIDLYFNGDYYRTTTWARTCKEAVSRCLENIEWLNHSIAGLTLVQERILKRPDLLKARFQK